MAIEKGYTTFGQFYQLLTDMGIEKCSISAAHCQGLAMDIWDKVSEEQFQLKLCDNDASPMPHAVITQMVAEWQSSLLPLSKFLKIQLPKLYGQQKISQPLINIDDLQYFK